MSRRSHRATCRSPRDEVRAVAEKSKPKLTHAQVKRQQRRGSGAAWMLVPVVAAVLIIGGALFFSNRGSAASNDLLKDVKTYADSGHNHVKSIIEQHPGYSTTPPTSGWHMPGLLPWSFYDKPQSYEYLVHNMEDGGVIMYYSPKASDAVTQQLRTLRETVNPKFSVVAPGQADQPEEVILTAWTVMLREPTFDSAKTEAFLRKYAGVDHHINGQG